MIHTERFLVDAQRPRIERLGLGEATLRVVKPRQVVQRSANIRMLGAQRFLVNHQRPPIERLHLGVATLLFVKPRQVV